MGSETSQSCQGALNTRGKLQIALRLRYPLLRVRYRVEFRTESQRTHIIHTCVCVCVYVCVCEQTVVAGRGCAG